MLLETATTVKAHAKINLTLDVLSRRADGYHEIESVMQKVELHDTIALNLVANGIRLLQLDGTPPGKQNLAYRAAESMIRQYRPGTGVEISLHKAIPMAAGLAGGSTDAAAVMRGLASLWGIEPEESEMVSVGMELGSDVPFCLNLSGPAALVRGKGEIILPIPLVPQFWLVLACPHGEIDSAWAYSQWDSGCRGNGPDLAGCVGALARSDLAALGECIGNVFEKPASHRVPIVLRLKNTLLDMGALGASLSGSGPTVFGIFQTENEAKSAATAISEAEPVRFLSVTRTLR